MEIFVQMKKRRTIVFGFILAFLLGVLLCQCSRKTTYIPENAIPSDAVAVVFSKNNESLLRSISEQNRVWKGIREVSTHPQNLYYLQQADSLLLHNSDYRKVVAGKQGILSLHQRAGDSLSTLLVLKLKSTREKKKTLSFFKEITKKESLKPIGKHKKWDCYRFETAKGYCFFSVKDELLTAASDLNLLHEAIDNLMAEGENTLWHSKRFINASLLWGKNVGANIYIAYPEMKKNAKGTLSGKDAIVPFPHPANFAAWSALDVSMKEKAWQFNGYTSAGDSSFLSVFDLQQPVSTNIQDLLPCNTSHFLLMSFSEPAVFMNSLSSVNICKSEDYESQLKYFNQKNNIKLHSDFARFAGRNICIAWIGSRSVACIQIRNKDAAANFMKKFSWSSSGIAPLETSQLLGMLLGNQLPYIKSGYCCMHKDYLLIAGSKSPIESIINNPGNSLGKTIKYKNATEFLDSKANLTFYGNGSGISGLFPDVKDKAVFEAFDGFAIQFSHSDGLFYTNAILHENAQYQFKQPDIFIPPTSPSPHIAQEDIGNNDADTSPGSLATETEKPEQPTGEAIAVPAKQDGKIILEGKMIGTPFPVYNHMSKCTNFIVFDNRKNAYLIDPKEGILWKRTLQETPVSAVYEIDYYNNGTIQYVFGSPSYIYALDATGNDVEGYPVKLETKAQNPLAVFDIQKNKDYSLLFVDKKGVVQCYDKGGNKKSSWNAPSVETDVSIPIQYCTKDNNRYLIVAMNDGSAMLYNERGDIKMTIKSSFTHNSGSDFYINKTNRKGILLTTDNKGDLIYIPEKGAVQKTDFPAVSDKHYFLYGDFSNNGHYDFIYIDQKELKVYDRFQNIILKHTFQHVPSEKPTFFTSGKISYLTVPIQAEGRVYILNKSGVVHSFPCTTNACMTKIKPNDAPVVVCGDGNEVVFYTIP